MFGNIFILISLAITVPSAIGQDCQEATYNINFKCNSVAKSTFYYKGASAKIIDTGFECSDYRVIRNAFPKTPLLTLTNVERPNGSLYDAAGLQEFTSFNIHDARIAYVPSNLNGKFPNLRSISFTSCDIAYLGQENLAQFGSLLKIVEFDNNKLISLDEDLFKNNPNVVYVSFKNNELQYIGSTFFTNLNLKNAISRVNFDNTEAGKAGCINQHQQLRNENGVFKTATWYNFGCNNEAARSTVILNKIKASYLSA